MNETQSIHPNPRHICFLSIRKMEQFIFLNEQPKLISKK